MDTIVPQEEAVNTEIVYENCCYDNVVTVSSSEVSNAYETENKEQEQKISTFQNIKSKLRTAKKGRPKGSLNQINPKPKRLKPVKEPRPPKILVKTENLEPNRLPRMGIQLAHFKLPPEKIEEYQKSQQPFLQPGVCFQIAPKLDLCIECTKFSVVRKKVHGDCRFYHFRKLK